MRPFNIHTLLEALATKRPVFHSEADFQHALAWQIRESTESDIRLEFRPCRNRSMCLDLWVPDQRVAVELKYLTRKLDWDTSGESFALRNQSAQDIRRYQVIKDVQRLESVSRAQHGIAIVLTHDSSYWKRARKDNPIDIAFRLHEGRLLSGTLRWSPDASTGTTEGREAAITLKGSYVCKWRDYGRPVVPNAKNARFRYLALEVSR